MSRCFHFWMKLWRMDVIFFLKMFITHNKSYLGLEVTFFIFIGNDWFYLLNRTSPFGLSIALCMSLAGVIFQEVISGISQFVVIVLFTILPHHPPTSLDVQFSSLMPVALSSSLLGQPWESLPTLDLLKEPASAVFIFSSIFLFQFHLFILWLLTFLSFL